MAEIPFDTYLDQEDDSDAFALLKPTGPYNFKIASGKADVSNNGNQQAKLQVTVTDGPNAGRTVFTQITLTDEKPRTFIDQVVAAGIGAPFLRQRPTMEQVVEALLGKFFSAEVNHREWPVGSGQLRNNFSFWTRFAGTEPTDVGVGVPDVQAPQPAAAPPVAEQAVLAAPAAPPAPATPPPSVPAPPPPAPVAAPIEPAAAPVEEEETVLDGPSTAPAPPPTPFD